VCDVTYREFEDPEELRGDLQHFFRRVADQCLKAAATPLDRAFDLPIPAGAREIATSARQVALAENSRQVVHSSPVAARTTERGDDTAENVERLAELAQKLREVMSLPQTVAGNGAGSNGKRKLQARAMR
jgi:hypothetical protein